MARYNWGLAKAYYIGHEDASYEDVSKKFGMSVSAIKYYQQRMDENWVELRRQAVQHMAASLPQKTGDKLAEFQAEKLKIGKFLIGVGVQGINEHKPRTAREAREVIDSGYKIATEAVGLDKPGATVNIQNNTLLTMDSFVLAMKQRMSERTTEHANSTRQNTEPSRGGGA
jgi:hypothetical protein